MASVREPRKNFIKTNGRNKLKRKLSMSSVKERTTLSFSQVGVFRNAFPVARYFFDIHIYKDGIAGFYIWKRNDIRIPIIHHLIDMRKRSSISGKTIEEAVESDDRNFNVTFDSIQGIVTDREHKEVQMLTTGEQIYFYFRPYEDYDAFVEILEENAGDKLYSRDDTEVNDAIYVS